MKDIKTFLEYLENIEYVFSEANYVDGEVLLDGNKVKQTAQLKNSWEFKCSGRPVNYLSIKINSKKLNNHSCTCKAYKEDKNCKHLAACYLWIRKELLSLSDVIEKAPPVKPRAKRSKNHIKDLLDDVSKEELISFLIVHARNDKKLNTALSVHFLSRTKHQTKSDFKLILDKIIQPVTRANQKVSASDWSLFFKTVESMLLQAKDASSISKFDFSINILITIYDKLYYVISKFEQHHSRILDQLKAANEVLVYTLSLIEAPLRKENYFKQFKEIINKSYFHNHLSFDFVHIFLENDIIPIETKRKIVAAYKALIHEAESQKIHTYSISLRLLSESSADLLDYFLSMEKSLIKPVLLEILAEKDIQTLKNLLKLNLTIDISIILELEYEIAKLEHNQKDISKKLLRLLELNRQISYYQLLKDHCELFNDKQTLAKAKKEILTWPPELKLDYFLIEEDFTSMMESLIELDDLDYHFEYTPQIPDSFQDQLIDLYFSTTSSYLNNHVGVTTAAYVQDLTSKLFKIHGQLISPKLVNMIRSKYGERKSLENLLKTLS